MKDKPEIPQVIIVEGRDDTSAIKRAVSAVTIETHGFGISQETWKRIDHAYRTQGIIIFTDPDHAGKEIRKRIKERYPEAREAFLSAKKAGKKKNQEDKKYQDIGIENASPEDIRDALSKVCAPMNSQDSFDNMDKSPLTKAYSIEDLDTNGLVGMPDSKERREALGDILGIGYYNGKSLLNALNGMRISREDFDEAIRKIEEGNK